jgi:predicted nucleic acid-binding Zn ribbon protein
MPVNDEWTDKEWTSINGLVGGLVQNMGLSQKLKECEALLAWDEVIEPNWKLVAKPSKLHKGRLEVWVSGAVRRTQLMFLQQEIIEKINERVGQKVVEELVIRNQRP